MKPDYRCDKTKKTCKSLYSFLKEWKSSHDGNSPSFDEIQENFTQPNGKRLSSKSTVSYYLRAMKEFNMIALGGFSKSRSLRLIEESSHTVDI